MTLNRAQRAALLALCLQLPVPVLADNHALVMGVSAYPRQPLQGVVRDVQNAQVLARQMNVPEANITVRTDRQLTLAGLLQSLTDLILRVKDGDRVFIYYSGHGSSYVQGGRCEQGLVTFDMKTLSRQQFQELIKPAVDRASKAVVFLDTCFSGGVIERSGFGTRDLEGTARAKTIDLLTDADGTKCEQPVNVSSRQLGDPDAESAVFTPNYYFLGAAAANEAAIDGGAAFGGYATSAILRCTAMASGADGNGDGVITLEEAAACAQVSINQLIADNRHRDPSFPFSAMTLTSGSGPGAGATPVAFANMADAPGESARIDSQALLETLQRGADDKHEVTIQPTRPSFKIGVDLLELKITSSRAGYLTLFSVGSSGKIFRLLPNRYDTASRIGAGVPMTLPRPEWRLRSRGPAGVSRFLAIVSSTPDRFADVGLPEGPFSSMPNTVGGVRRLVERTVAPAPDCAKPQRDFEPVGNACTSAYGAGQASVHEVE